MQIARTGAQTIFLAALLTGCSHQVENPGKLLPGSPSVEQTRSSELRRAQFADIPVPNGFELVTRGNRSYTYQGGGVRLAALRYWGKQSPAAVAAFYRRTMPLQAYGWAASGERLESGVSVLGFNKELQTCEVTIEKKGRATVILMRISGPH